MRLVYYQDRERLGFALIFLHFLIVNKNIAFLYLNVAINLSDQIT